MADAENRSRSTVLVVEDDPDLLEVYREWLSDDYDVRLAPDGMRAVEAMDESVAVVLLDRKMPDVRGDEVLARIREWGYDCKIVIVSALSPAEALFDPSFDEYVQKPVTRDRLLEVVDGLLGRNL